MPKQTKSSTAVEEYSWDEESVSGFENTSDSDFGIPFVQMIQKGSPEYDEEHPDHGTKVIEGIKPGMIINSLSREVLFAKKDDEPMLFIPFYAEKLYAEFKARNTGGGFVQMHRDQGVLNRCLRNDKNKDILQDEPGKGNEITTTHYFYGLAKSADGSWSKVIIGFTSTQLKKGRLWLNMMRSRKTPSGKIMPMFSHIYAIKSTPESNSEGSWFGWTVEVHKMLNPNDEDQRQLVTAARGGAVELSEQLALPDHAE